MGKVQDRKAKLRDRLIDAAEAQIVDGGLNTVKARDMARKAECALGAIYNVFDDINDLVMAVNGRTFHKLGEVVSVAVENARDETPNDQLIAMSKAYLGFAAENTYLWRALFDLEMSSESKVPEWYLAELAQLFAHIGRPLALLFPELPRDELDLMVRALFSSVHGIVLLGLEKRISGVPRPQIEHMLGQVLSQIGK
ncbi:MAG: AcrR family transcriptional regulator [Ascidiaceihabitans sp.]|jgi:AcrR family transcriptional regulator